MTERAVKQWWEHFPHGADVGIRGVGETKARAFEQAALAMSAAITDLDAITPAREVEIHCEAPDDDLLLVEWLNALVYEMATRRMLFSRYEVQIDGHRLCGRAWGEGVDRDRHQAAVEIKGATYTALGVEQNRDGSWRAQCVVDV